MQTWKATKALYRWLGEPDVTFAALMQPHFQQTRAQATAAPVTLRVPDTTDIDLSYRRKISGVGQIGKERGRGFSSKRCWRCILLQEQCWGASLTLKNPLCAFPRQRREARYHRRKRAER